MSSSFWKIRSPYKGLLLRLKSRVVLAAVLIFVSSCSRPSAVSYERLAILPANVLISDPSSEWLRLAVPLILQEDLATSRHLVASDASGVSGAYQLGATEALRTTVENRKGRIAIDAVVTDLSTQRNRKVLRVDGRDSDGLLAIADALAHKIDEHAGNFPTRNVRALQAFTAAAESANAGTRVQLLDQAILTDPSFGLAYIALAGSALQTHDQNLSALLQTAASHRSSFTPLDRALFNALSAQLSHAPLTEQNNAFSAVLQLAPNNIDALVALGSGHFLEGDGAGGARLLKRALELSPGNANIRNRLAHGLIETRQFADAEKVLSSLGNNPAALPELAVCILLEGDTARANRVLEKYLALRAPGDTVTPLLRAGWIAIAGEDAKAIGSLESVQFQDENLRSIALAQLTIWQLAAKDFAGAKKNAALGMRQNTRNSFATVAMLLSEGDLPPAEWRDRVNASPLNDQAKQAILGYGFFLYGRYSEAAQIWQMVLRQSGASDLPARTMLAASLDRESKIAESRRILVQPFIPELGDLYASISFGEMRRLIR